MRGLAIGLVLLAHWGLPDRSELLRGAPWIGADVFFVLSGFLITRLLLDEAAAAGSIYLKGFWARRGLRLLPLSTLVILGVALTTAVWPDAYVRSGADVSPARAVIAALFYHMNWLQVGPSTHHIWALTAMWSLSVEEQFYSVWPLVVSACVVGTAGRPRLMVRRVAIVSAIIIVLSLAARAYLMQAKEFHHVYNGIDSRAGQLCAGTFLAAMSILWPTAVRKLSRLAPLGLLGLAMIAVRLILDRRWLGVGYDVVAGLSVLLVAGAVTVEGWTGRLLADSRLRWLGVRAYALYLVHYPLFLLLTCTRLSWMPDWIVQIGRMILAIGLADALHRYVEKPLMRLRRGHSIFAQAIPVPARQVPAGATQGGPG